jgi:hypothetical protein
VIVRDTYLCLLPKLTKRQRINQPQQQRAKEVGGRRRRQQIKRGGGPGGWKAVARGKVKAATQQPIMVDNKRQWCMQRHQQTGGKGMMRCNAITSQDG